LAVCLSLHDDTQRRWATNGSTQLMTQAILTASTILTDAVQGLMDLIHDMKIKSEQRALVRKTKIELSQLSDHELKDLGIGRSDITSIANGTFHDNRSIVEENRNLRGWV
jgi:uncharacterized protein YjiS (DUF1127 family)